MQKMPKRNSEDNTTVNTSDVFRLIMLRNGKILAYNRDRSTIAIADMSDDLKCIFNGLRVAYIRGLISPDGEILKIKHIEWQDWS